VEGTIQIAPSAIGLLVALSQSVNKFISQGHKNEN
jgi:hypothetical protein